MSTIRIALQIILIALSSFGIGTGMEAYKKVVRKGNANIWEIRAIAGVASAIAAVAFYFTGLFTPVISAVFPSVTVWLDVVLYAIVTFVLQLESDMKLIKLVIKITASSLLGSTDGLASEIKAFFESFKDNTGIDAMSIAKLLKLANIDEDSVKALFTEVGMPEDKATELINAYKEVV